MIDSRDFPTELPGDPDGGAGALRWTSGVIALAAFALALLNPDAIAIWTQELTPGPRTAPLVAAADAWKAATNRIGLDAPHAGLHRAWRDGEAARWPGAPSGEARSDSGCSGSADCASGSRSPG